MILLLIVVMKCPAVGLLVAVRGDPLTDNDAKFSAASVYYHALKVYYSVISFCQFTYACQCIIQGAIKSVL